MPDEIYILLASKDKNEISYRNCLFEYLLVRDHDEKTILGRYMADGELGDDCLLSYRKYVKDTTTSGVDCHNYAMQKSKLFYHKNQFFTITVVSDDEKFIGRASLPF